jgi:hypothetical protein
MRRLLVLAVAPVLWLDAAAAQDAEPAPPPDLDFLEYLGTWGDGEDEWLEIEEWRKGDDEEAGEGRERPERERERDDGDESE